MACPEKGEEFVTGRRESKPKGQKVQGKNASDIFLDFADKACKGGACPLQFGRLKEQRLHSGPMVWHVAFFFLDAEFMDEKAALRKRADSVGAVAGNVENDDRQTAIGFSSCGRRTRHVFPAALSRVRFAGLSRPGPVATHGCVSARVRNL
jgi:hypothetical protein